MNDIIDTPSPRNAQTVASEQRESQAALENAATQNGKLSERFTGQLAATRENLNRLERVASEHPALFEHGSLIEVTPDHSRVYLHASRDPERDWKTFVKRYPGNWRRDSTATDGSFWDYRGSVGGVQIVVLCAEKRAEAEAL